MTGCDYCNSLIPLMEVTNGTIYVENRTLINFINWDYDNDCPSTEHESIKINYCPMCGRKLENK